ncbi:hypothetical protein BaRGS_00035110 [Batillaria attramentaria]|uniref:Uncharacterized protein n=1 Tax=Batillaria attramentaria TaxID=370345 RepID=A0ABD0JFD2_9CAEN
MHSLSKGLLSSCAVFNELSETRLGTLSPVRGFCHFTILTWFGKGLRRERKQEIFKKRQKQATEQRSNMAPSRGNEKERESNVKCETETDQSSDRQCPVMECACVKGQDCILRQAL